eukprot:TRINITY_DN12096_c0_g1_i1.p1 TRINITY_DN12096_c0_g1~~TRINITY_DN12096_c0_g1_i1.p1  ORF type:complete len:134 (+),score=33.35 TRINITY_DN12096_c0_g1_i1:175-576(+)
MSSGVVKRKTKGNANNNSGGSSSVQAGESLWQKAKRRDVTWEKEDIQDVVHWLRQIIAVIIGFLWGLIGIQGFIGIATFFTIAVGAVYLYYTKYLNIDDEEFLSKASLVQEGLATSFSVFLTCWILAFNIFHV